MNTDTVQCTTKATQPTNDRDELLWQLAKKRAAFKVSLSTYLAVNTLLIAIWYFTSGVGSYFWPVWSILGWGLGVTMQYLDAYHGQKLFSTEREYEKLKNNQSL